MCAIDKSPQNDPALKQQCRHLYHRSSVSNFANFDQNLMQKSSRKFLVGYHTGRGGGGGENIFTNTFVCYYSGCAKVLVEIFAPQGMVAYEEFS